eukprot:709294-Rhodomonas_salina.2
MNSNKRALEEQDPVVERDPKVARFVKYAEAEHQYRGKLINTAVLFLQLQEQVRRAVAARHERDEKERMISLELAQKFPMPVDEDEASSSRNIQDHSDRLSLNVEATMSPSEEAATGIKFQGSEKAKDVASSASGLKEVEPVFEEMTMQTAVH